MVVIPSRGLRLLEFPRYEFQQDPEDYVVIPSRGLRLLELNTSVRYSSRVTAVVIPSRGLRLLEFEAIGSACSELNKSCNPLARIEVIRIYPIF